MTKKHNKSNNPKNDPSKNSHAESADNKNNTSPEKPAEAKAHEKVNGQANEKGKAQSTQDNQQTKTEANDSVKATDGETTDASKPPVADKAQDKSQHATETSESTSKHTKPSDSANENEAAKKSDKHPTDNVKQNEQSTQPTQKAMNDSNKSSTAASTATSTASQSKNEINTKIDTNHTKASSPAGQPKKSSPLAGLALLTGVAGVGLAGYNFMNIQGGNQASEQANMSQQLTSLDEQIQSINAALPSDINLAQTLDSLTKEQTALTEQADRFAARISEIEQMQNGLEQVLNNDLSNTPSEITQTVATLDERIGELTLAQQGLTTRLSQLDDQLTNTEGSSLGAGTDISPNTTSKQIATMEIGYLLRLADTTLKTSGDSQLAQTLLSKAATRLEQSELANRDNLLQAVRARIIQLQGVTPLDIEALDKQLSVIQTQLPELTAKTAETSDSNADASGESAASDEAMADTNTSSNENSNASNNQSSKDFLQKMGDVIASGVKYTPNDPNQINISAETALIQKQLLLVDLQTMKLAILSKNKPLLQETITMMRQRLTDNFADNAARQAIVAELATIEAVQLETLLPDLAPLIAQFEQATAQ